MSLRKGLELTDEEMDNLMVTVKGGSTMKEMFDQYRVKVRDAQLDKVFNHPDIAMMVKTPPCVGKEQDEYARLPVKRVIPLSGLKEVKDD